MLKMAQIDLIYEMNRKGISKSEISRTLKMSRKTVRKYLKKQEYTQVVTPDKSHPSKLDRWKGIIQSWLDDDKRMRFKQRHTAKRIHQRLKELYPGDYDCSYPIVQRYVKKWKTELRQDKGTLELVWHKGEAQADFGEADCYENGELKAFKFLCVSFPNSNAGYIQIFGGETAECVTRGLVDIFRRIGGVPIRMVFDNASGAGRRIGEKIQYAELFLRFKCHYNFDVTFCNPYSGHEKGNVENKVGYSRRNMLVPAPSFESVEKFNEELLIKSEADWNREHYKKMLKISDLFQEERKALSPLPLKEFRAVRFEKVKTDQYGKFCLDGKHWYSSSPEYSKTEVIAGIGAHQIEVLDNTGQLICVHKRIYGANRTDSVDWSSTVNRLIKNPGAWRNSGLRESFPQILKENIDEMDKEHFRGALRILDKLSRQYDYETAVEAMKEAVKRNTFDGYSADAIAARILCNGLDVLPEKGPDLASYDRLIEGME